MRCGSFSGFFAGCERPGKGRAPGARGVLPTIKEAVHGIDIKRVMRCKYPAAWFDREEIAA